MWEGGNEIELTSFFPFFPFFNPISDLSHPSIHPSTYYISPNSNPPRDTQSGLPTPSLTRTSRIVDISECNTEFIAGRGKIAAYEPGTGYCGVASDQEVFLFFFPTPPFPLPLREEREKYRTSCSSCGRRRRRMRWRRRRGCI